MGASQEAGIGEVTEELMEVDESILENEKSNDSIEKTKDEINNNKIKDYDEAANNEHGKDNEEEEEENHAEESDQSDTDTFNQNNDDKKHLNDIDDGYNLQESDQDQAENDEENYTDQNDDQNDKIDRSNDDEREYLNGNDNNSDSDAYEDNHQEKTDQESIHDTENDEDLNEEEKDDKDSQNESENLEEEKYEEEDKDSENKNEKEHINTGINNHDQNGDDNIPKKPLKSNQEEKIEEVDEFVPIQVSEDESDDKSDNDEEDFQLPGELSKPKQNKISPMKSGRRMSLRRSTRSQHHFSEESSSDNESENENGRNVIEEEKEESIIKDDLSEHNENTNKIDELGNKNEERNEKYGETEENKENKVNNDESDDEEEYKEPIPKRRSRRRDNSKTEEKDENTMIPPLPTRRSSRRRTVTTGIKLPISHVTTEKEEVKPKKTKSVSKTITDKNTETKKKPVTTRKRGRKPKSTKFIESTPIIEPRTSRRGRPKKVIIPEINDEPPTKRRRGRPRKSESAETPNRFDDSGLATRRSSRIASKPQLPTPIVKEKPKPTRMSLRQKSSISQSSTSKARQSHNLPLRRNQSRSSKTVTGLNDFFSDSDESDEDYVARKNPLARNSLAGSTRKRLSLPVFRAPIFLNENLKNCPLDGVFLPLSSSQNRLEHPLLGSSLVSVVVAPRRLARDRIRLKPHAKAIEFLQKSHRTTEPISMEDEESSDAMEIDMKHEHNQHDSTLSPTTTIESPSPTDDNEEVEKEDKTNLNERPPINTKSTTNLSQPQSPIVSTTNDSINPNKEQTKMIEDLETPYRLIALECPPGMDFGRKGTSSSSNKPHLIKASSIIDTVKLETPQTPYQEAPRRSGRKHTENMNKDVYDFLTTADEPSKKRRRKDPPETETKRKRGRPKKSHTDTPAPARLTRQRTRHSMNPDSELPNFQHMLQGDSSDIFDEEAIAPASAKNGKQGILQNQVLMEVPFWSLHTVSRKKGRDIVRALITQPNTVISQSSFTNRSPCSVCLTGIGALSLLIKLTSQLPTCQRKLCYVEMLMPILCDLMNGRKVLPMENCEFASVNLICNILSSCVSRTYFKEDESIELQSEWSLMGEFAYALSRFRARSGRHAKLACNRISKTLSLFYSDENVIKPPTDASTSTRISDIHPSKPVLRTRNRMDEPYIV
eukprot:TRINITY_DN15708_c0_g1_i1.p1 TRINITY_DN15708_c0_g1~~TRINITY_DN15708_c0_g1_i1.p1  ORF type:complete len:1292 (-),score=460.67 TRINITY_DN15708_c0_g1_i1:104-3616(-)